MIEYFVWIDIITYKNKYLLRLETKNKGMIYDKIK